MLVRLQLRPQLSALAQPCALQEPVPGSRVTPCPSPLRASVLASVQWVVRTREAVMTPSSPVHLEIQVFWRGVEIPKPEVGAGASDCLRTLFVAPRTQSRGVEGLRQEPEGCTMAQAAAGGL